RFEYRGPSNNRVCAGGNNLTSVLSVLAAINLDPRAQSSNFAKAPQIGNFRQHFWKEFLAPEPRIDRHHENDIAEVQHMFCKRYRARRVQDDPGFCAKLADTRQHAMQMGRR